LYYSSLAKNCLPTKRRGYVNSKIDNTIKYAIQLAMLKKLEAKNLITIAEYKTIKEFLERKYRPNIA